MGNVKVSIDVGDRVSTTYLPDLILPYLTLKHPLLKVVYLNLSTSRAVSGVFVLFQPVLSASDIRPGYFQAGLLNQLPINNNSLPREYY